MRCPYCHSDEIKVTDSRATDDNSIRRRRECITCARRFTTYETIEELPLMVIKRSGNKEMFDRSKLLKGLLRSTSKRDIRMDDLESIVGETERRIRQEGLREITTEEIGNIVLSQLRHLDPVAYVRFASVYRKFDNIESFLHELQDLMEGK